MSWTQVTTTPRYTKREKQAYRARVKLRQQGWFIAATGRTVEEWHAEARRHHFADGLGSRVPTQRVSPEYL